MKILLATNCSNNRDSSGRQVMQLALQLARSEHKVTVMYRYAESTVRDFAPYDRSNITVIRSAAEQTAKRFKKLALVGEVRKLVREQKFDLIHTFADFLPIAVAASLGLRTPIVANCEHYSRQNRLLNACLHLRRVGVVVAASESTRDALMERESLDGDKVRVVYQSIDTDQFNADNRGFISRDDLNVPDGAYLIGFCGELGRAGGLQYLIDALTTLQSDNIDYHLLLIGIFPQQLQEHGLSVPTRIINMIHCTGHTFEPENYIAKLDLLVAPQTSGSLLNEYVLEAASMQVPVITTNVADNCEFIHHKKTGLLIKPANIAAIVDAIHFASHNPITMHSMAANAKHDIQDRFSIASRTNQLMALYQTGKATKPVYYPNTAHAPVPSHD